MSTTLHQRSCANYQRLLRLVPDLEQLRSGSYRRFTSTGFMDLSFEVLWREDHSMDIAIAHYYKQNGDCVPDPDMRIRLNLRTKTAWPTSFQNAMVYREAMHENGDFNRRELMSQSSFLSLWLRNLQSQGHTAAIPVQE